LTDSAGTDDGQSFIEVRLGASGNGACNDDRRQFGPGDAVLVEDTLVKGHITTPLTPDFRIAMIPVP
jgi:hypothetical protein